MAPSPEILAAVFDFDETLAPDSTTRLLESFGYDTGTFWKEDVRALVSRGYDPTLAWLNLFLADVKMADGRRPATQAVCPLGEPTLTLQREVIWRWSVTETMPVSHREPASDDCIATDWTVTAGE